MLAGVHPFTATVIFAKIWAYRAIGLFRVDKFEEGKITVCQDFMNSAVIKYHKIAASHEVFKASVHTVQVDIIALLATKQKAKLDQPKH